MSEIADGTQKRANKAGSKIKAPVGSCSLVYDDGLTEWTRLREDQFNTMPIGSWRLDLGEMGRDAGAASSGNCGCGGNGDLESNDDDEIKSASDSSSSSSSSDSDSDADKSQEEP